MSKEILLFCAIFQSGTIWPNSLAWPDRNSQGES